jgi:hypothetical protein
MPRNADPGDARAMTEAWRLHLLRCPTGYSCDAVAEALGIGTLALWRLENSPAFVGAAMMNVMLLARFFGYALRLHLERLGMTPID